jgi:PAS domain S-box-containing protein
MIRRTRTPQNLPRGELKAASAPTGRQSSWPRLPAFQKIIDALADHITVLDEKGDIIAVNAAWQRFGAANGLRTPNYGVGLNYLAVCDAATGPGSEEAVRVARCLRQLLGERKGEFRWDYPCHSPEEQRWFQLRATCLQDRSRFHLVLAHQNITEIMQSQQQLHEVSDQLEHWVRQRTDALDHTSNELRGAISEREQAELARNRLAAIVEYSQDAIISKDLNGTITSWNASAERLFGYRAEEAIGQPLTLLIPPDKRSEEAAMLERLRRGQRIEHQETVRVARDGRRIQVLVTVSPVRDASGAVIGASKILRDITERKRSEAALRQAQTELESRVSERTAELAQANEALRSSERRLAILAAATFEGIAITEEARFVDANEQLARMLGYTRQELLGKQVETFLPPEEQPRVLPNIRNGQESHLEHEMLRKDGSRLVVEAHGQTVAVEGRPVRFTALRDITERRRMAQALARYTEELDRRVEERTAELSETVEELQHFSYALLHDLRAPLRAMMSFANLIEMRCGAACQQPEVLNYLSRIKASSERMDHLVRDALNYARVLRRDLPLRPVPLLPLLHGLLESYPELWPHQSEIQLAPNLPVVLGNEAVLTECFSNLLRNAVKFVAPGVTPRVRVWAQEMPSAAGGVRNEQNGEWAVTSGGETATGQASSPVPRPSPPMVRVWVEDNGIGIPKEDQESIFTMFRQLHPTEAYPGTGIGLAIVRKGIQRIGGRVGVESEPGRGSRFWLELEQVKSPVPPEA